MLLLFIPGYLTISNRNLWRSDIDKTCKLSYSFHCFIKENFTHELFR